MTHTPPGHHDLMAALRVSLGLPPWDEASHEPCRGHKDRYTNRTFYVRRCRACTVRRRRSDPALALRLRRMVQP